MRWHIALLVVAVMGVALFAGNNAPEAEGHGFSSRRIVSQDTGKCLDVVGGTGPQTHLWDCVGVSWQNWDIVHYSGDWHYIKNKKPGTNLCLDVPGGQSGDIQLQWYTCNETPAQLFKVPTCNLCFAEIRNHASNKCVDVQYSAVGNGTVIWQYTCNNTRAQMWAPDNHDAGSSGGVLEKSLFTDRWYQFYEDSYNYTTWMTLSTHKHIDSGFSANWSAPVSAALADWNNASVAPNTVFFSVNSGSDPEDDVHIAVTNDCVVHWGKTLCTYDALGMNYHFDQQKDPCQGGDCSVGPSDSKPNTWWYSMTLLDDDEHSGSYGTALKRQATVAHELGHAIVLAHEAYNFQCGPPASVMDYDCVLNATQQNGWYRPQQWDSCGINHAYYDPNWGWAGC